MPSFRDGQVNILGITNPGVYVDQILPTAFIAGVPTNIEGIVGVGSWGPVGGVKFFNTPDDCAGIFGFPAARSYDLPSYVETAYQEGSNISFAGVRVSDGTDVAAAATITSSGTFTARYTGTRGNAITIGFQKTAAAAAYACVISFPGRTPERFDNIAAPTVGAFWANLALAINNGTAQRGKSNYVVFTAASTPSVAAVLNTPTTLTGGTDGTSGVASSQLVGQDVLPRTGMYALRGAGTDCFAICDLTDATTWGVQLAFAISEACYAISATASGDTIASAVAARTTAGIDDPSIKIIEGDWPTTYSSYLGVSRLVSPQAAAIGLFGNLSPEQSPINKRLNSVIATQTSTQGILTANADESTAQTGGIDLIGKSAALNEDFFSFLTGRNASSNTAANGDEYTRLTNFLIKSLEGAATRSIVGKLQSVQPNDPTRTNALMVVNSFLQSLVDPSSGSGGYGMIDSFSCQCDQNNNTPTTIAQGFLFLYAAVRYLATVRYFVIKLAGGNNVTVTSQSSAPTAAQLS